MLCKRSGKSVDYLLYCDVASALWSALFTRFGLSWVMSRSVIELFAYWWTSRRPRSAVIWKTVPICLFWCLWKEINNRCFEDIERSWRIFYLRFFILCIFGQWLLCPHYRLVLPIFLFVFLFLFRCFILYTAGVFRGALHF
jgi:hypothetical protein